MRSSRFIRLRLPDGSFGKVVPVEVYPRYSTLIGSPYAHELFDVSGFRSVSIPKGHRLTIEVVTADDVDRGWDGLPTMSRGRAASRFRVRRRTEKFGPLRKQSSSRGLKSQGHTRGG